MFRKLVALAVTLGALSFGAARAEQAFQEAGNLVVIEAEHARTNNLWTPETTYTGYTGAAYMMWKKGGDIAAVDAQPGTGTGGNISGGSGGSGGTTTVGGGSITPDGQNIMSYRIRIHNPGIYRLQLRIWDDTNRNPVFGNAVWVRFPDAGPEGASVQTSTGSSIINLKQEWFPIGNNKGGNVWDWTTLYMLPPNYDYVTVNFATADAAYTLQLGGRVRNFAYDRILLYQNSVDGKDLANTIAFVQDITIPESPFIDPPPPGTEIPPVFLQKTNLTTTGGPTGSGTGINRQFGTGTTTTGSGINRDLGTTTTTTPATGGTGTTAPTTNPNSFGTPAKSNPITNTGNTGGQSGAPATNGVKRG